MIKTKGLAIIPLPVKALPINEDEVRVIKKVCKFFGCAKILSLTESLCGDYCISCMNRKPKTFFNTKL